MGKKQKGKIESVILVLFTLIAVATALLLFFVYTKPGKRLTSKMVAGYLHGSVNYVAGNRSKGSVPKNNPVDSKVEEEETAEKDNPEENIPVEEKEDAYYHILFLGEEALKTSAGKGRTDSIILVTIDGEQKRVMLTSVLRDCYVEPEGMYPCKLNAVYAKQGVNGVNRIIYEKLGVWPDGYVKVGFDSFEAIIDLLGGAEVTLTAQEAEYLNTHDYISKEEYRNVTEGTQVLNGNQTLGYCRVRYVPNCNGTKYDYGRTERQRMVLSNLFERYKEAGITKWFKILKEALGYIETDISEELMEELIYTIYDGEIRNMEQYQIPVKGTFHSRDSIGNVTSTLEVDWKENRNYFWNLLK